MRILTTVNKFTPAVLRPFSSWLYGRFFSERERLTTSQKQFIRENRAYWKKYANHHRNGAYVLIEPKYDPITLLGNVSHAAIVAHARNLTPLFMLRSRMDTVSKRIMESCPNATFIYLDDKRYVDARKQTDLLAREAYETMKSPEDLIKFEVDGIDFGSLIYDQVLYSRYATLRTIDERVLDCLKDFFWYRFVVRDVIDRYRIETSIISHHYVGLMPGTFTRYLVQRGIEVMSHLGTGHVVLKKFHTLEDVGIFPHTAEPCYFSLMQNWPDDTVIKQADEFMERRFSQKQVNISLGVVFDSSKRLFKSREEFSEHFGLDPRKKLVFVMLHSFNDWPRSLFRGSMIYRDYCDWFEKTLEIAKTADSVNWVFKEHPSSALYPTLDLDLGGVFGQLDYPHIRFLNYKADFNELALRTIADTIITCAGSAGLEYSCVGVPAVLAGPSSYSGLGFTIEPRNAVEYEYQLRHLTELGRLNAEQIKTAKLFLFFQFGIMADIPYLFCPEFDFSRVVESDPTFIWQEAAKYVLTADRKGMDRQVAALSDFFRNPAWIQLVDFDKYPFLKGAIEGT